jgi:carboxylate-amine ligase
MAGREPSFTIGIEEEYLLVDRESRDVAIEPPEEIFEQCGSVTDRGLVEPELLRSQIEVGTSVCRTVAEAKADLARLRRLVCEVSGGYGLAPVAASTHPFAEWHLQHLTHKARYDLLLRDMQSLARRLLICGMHVHVGIEDDELRVKLLNQFTQYLPLLLALSTSSPFWQGEDTGLKSYRLTVFDNFPRSGLPERFESFSDYQHHIDILRRSGVLEDATFIWWDLRISARYPTLETRVADMCTVLDDTAGIAALTQSILHYLYRMHCDRNPVSDYSRFLVDQNRWRAMRYGYDEGLVDFANSDVVQVDDLLADIYELVAADADELGCVRELEYALGIPGRGTSAHRQLQVYHAALDEGLQPAEALCRVVDALIDETAGDATLA